MVQISEEMVKRLINYVQFFNLETAGDFGENPLPYAIVERDVRQLEGLIGIDPENSSSKKYNDMNGTEAFDDVINEIMNTTMTAEECREILYETICNYDEEEADSWMEGFDPDFKGVAYYSLKDSADAEDCDVDYITDEELASDDEFRESFINALSEVDREEARKHFENVRSIMETLYGTKQNVYPRPIEVNNERIVNGNATLFDLNDNGIYNPLQEQIEYGMDDYSYDNIYDDTDNNNDSADEFYD